VIYVYGIGLAMGVGFLFGAFDLPGPFIPNFWAALQIPAITLGWMLARWLFS